MTPTFVSTADCEGIKEARGDDDQDDDGDGDDGGSGGGGEGGGGGNPGRGDDPMSRCVDNPDACGETEEEPTCESEWDQTTHTVTVTCSY